MLPQHCWTASRTQTRTCLKGRPPTTTDLTDLQEYTETVNAYIKNCIDYVTVTKITTHPNQKPWMTAEVRGLLKTRDEAFRSGDKAALKTARANLSYGIKNAKRPYMLKTSIIISQTAETHRACGEPFILSLTTLRTSPGPPTPCQSPRRRNSDYTFSAS